MPAAFSARIFPTSSALISSRIRFPSRTCAAIRLPFGGFEADESSTGGSTSKPRTALWRIALRRNAKTSDLSTPTLILKAFLASFCNFCVFAGLIGIQPFQIPADSKGLFGFVLHFLRFGGPFGLQAGVTCAGRRAV